MTQEQPGSSFREILANRSVVLLLIVAFISLLAACILGVLLLRPLLGGEAAAEPTPFATSQAAAPINEIVRGVSESSTISVTLQSPTSLQINGEEFSVYPQVIEVDGRWDPPVAGEGTAVWVAGSIINYIIGLPFTEANQTLLEQLALGDEIVLTKQDGTTFDFTFNSREMVAASNRDIFSQNVPGITLVLLDMEGEERLVVKGDYVVPDPQIGGGGNVVELGEPAQLEDIQITVIGATTVSGEAQAPAGFAYYLIEYEIQNIGLATFNTGELQFTLVDELGNQYAQNPQASQLGNPLSGVLNAGQQEVAAAGYQIPAGLVSPTLNWIVSLPQTGGRVQVEIPFTTGGSAAQNALISLTEAALSPDRTNLDLLGTITNVGDRPVVVTEQDISLQTSNGTAFQLLSVNPRFPWQVLPGETVEFSVSFQLPMTADRAIFSLLNQSYEVSNWQ